jgi:hypothetical protein
MSADPALGEYIPAPGTGSDDLPGYGGVYNPINTHLYAYTHNNPIKMSDPDGRIPTFVVSAIIGFVSSTAVEVGSRMASGQGFGEVVKNTVTDKNARINILVSTGMGALTSGASGLAVKTATTTIRNAAVIGANTMAKEAITAVAINTVSGAVDAGLKDVAIKAWSGQEQNLAETGEKMLEGAGNALITGTLTQGTIAAGTKVKTYTYNGIERTVTYPPNWSGAAGVAGENIIPAGYDVYQEISNSQKQTGIPE